MQERKKKTIKLLVCAEICFIMWFDDQQKRATFESQKFAEGRFRNAYKGTWTNPQERRGRKCVVKEKKDTYTWNPTDWDTSLKIQKKAQELADSFNLSSHSYQISFTKKLMSFRWLKLTRFLGQDPMSTFLLKISSLVTSRNGATITDLSQTRPRLQLLRCQHSCTGAGFTREAK